MSVQAYVALQFPGCLSDSRQGHTRDRLLLELGRLDSLKQARLKLINEHAIVSTFGTQTPAQSPSKQPSLPEMNPLQGESGIF